MPVLFAQARRFLRLAITQHSGWHQKTEVSIFRDMKKVCRQKEKTAELPSSLGTDPFLSFAGHFPYSCPKEYEK